MPIFDLKCMGRSCGHIEKDVLFRSCDLASIGLSPACPKCSDFMFKMPTVPNMHLFHKDGIHLKHVEPGGKTFHSKNEMKQYAKKHDMDLGALL